MAATTILDFYDKWMFVCLHLFTFYLDMSRFIIMCCGTDWCFQFLKLLV